MWRGVLEFLYFVNCSQTFEGHSISLKFRMGRLVIVVLRIKQYKQKG